ncbi:LysE family translocator [Thiospirochaeta perfilievii]|uniref:LysE family translocator n=1 Tax=Thiospirochaeta perfilievii TaxID=252967 RepID=A0A5C1QAW6_9SPIO|nr:LysE family translocator [Thiospirochaeta perfilievii]QEN04627.1 LysE family translocator [Thiospirochaeta perfilievii]
MNSDFTIPVILFAITMSITPGPNNIMLTTSGANYGFLRTIPHILGVVTGVAILNIISALGLNRVFEAYPNIHIILKYIGMIYMLFLAVKIARSSEPKSHKGMQKPLNFIQAILFQALNPKAVIMSLTAITVYSLKGEMFTKSIYYIVITFLIFGTLSISTWALFGTLIKNVLKNPKHLKFFNYTMGAFCGISALLLLSS